MQLYKAVIKPNISFISELQSDTFFGAFCWSYRYKYGESELIKLLEKFWADKPPIIFSNAFPSGTLPLPLGIYDEANNFEHILDKKERQKAYQNNKKIKNAKYVSLKKFNEIINGNCNGFTTELFNDNKTSFTVPHNMVSRNSGIVENVDGSGNLFETSEYFVDNKTYYDIFILTDMNYDVVKDVLKLMFYLGIGANKSIGKGSFSLVEFKEFKEFDYPNEPNAFITLSNFIPNEDDPTEGFYKTFVKFPKVDREFAGSETPFKKPMMFIKSGAYFYTDNAKSFYGRCMNNVSAISKDISISGYTIAIPAVKMKNI